MFVKPQAQSAGEVKCLSLASIYREHKVARTSVSAPVISLARKCTDIL